MKSQSTESGKRQEKVNSDSDLKQGQASHDNEKPVPSSSTTMDETAPPPPSQSTAPQVRSRVTVVCAECKRLKLKCDRRSPCGSCTKRDTISRCIYSPAAAEKVDLHSINNRLIQVETTLALITAGKTPPQFQSSYPQAQVSLTTSHTATERKDSFATSNVVSPISIRVQDLMQIWLSHCQVDYPYYPLNPNEVQERSCVKQEQFSPEQLQFSETYPPNTIVIDEGPSNTTTAPAPAPASPTVHSSLPHIYMYRRLPIDNERYSQHATGKSSSSSTFPQLATEQPAATPAVISYLPPPIIRTRLLNNVHSAAPHLFLLIQWTRVVDLANPEADPSRAEKERQKALARTTFLGTNPTSRSPSPVLVPSSPPVVSLPLFACLCYLLALGALEPGLHSAALHSNLYALASQATSVWEEYTASADAKNDEALSEGTCTSTLRATRAEKEEEDLDYVVALLLQVKYLLRARSSISSQDLPKALFPSIGKLVNTARNMGLARDPEEDLGVPRGSKLDERRRMIWWDIMYHDVFTSDALGLPPLISMYSYSTKMPVTARPTLSVSTPVIHLVGGGGGHSSDANEHEGEAFQRRPSTAKSSSASCGGIPPRVIPPPKAKDKAKVPPIQDDAEAGFFGVRCRLTQLAQTLKYRLSSPGCECCTCGNGYTVDQAAKLEGEIRTWAADLPSPLLLEPSSPSPSSPVPRSPRHTAIAAELAVLANRMIIAVYLPLMRPPAEGAASSSSKVYGTNSWSPASRATVDAAQGVVRAARVLHQLMQTESEMSPFMDGLYPPQKAVADALIICAHSGLASATSGRAAAMTEEVDIALELLGKMRMLKGDVAQIISSLKRRLEVVGDGSRKGAENSLKRKHAMLEAAPPAERSVQGMPMTVNLEDDAQNNFQRQDTQFPRHGVRNRGKYTPSWTMDVLGDPDAGIPNQRVNKVVSSTQRETYQQSTQPRLPSAHHPLDQDNEYRPRSSHNSHGAQPQSSTQLSHYVDGQDTDPRTSQRRRFNVSAQGQPQELRRQPVQAQPSFTTPSSVSYISNQSPSRPSAFDTSGGFEGTDSGSSMNGSSSPYSGPPLSVADSPFGSTTEHLSYALKSHHSSPPAPTQQSTRSSPPEYYQIASGYAASFEGQPQQSGVRSMPMSSRMPYIHTSEATGAASLPPTPISDEAPQHLMYTMKGSAEIQQQHQMHSYQLIDERSTSGGMPVNPSTPQTWTATPYMQSQQQSLVGQQSAQYWSTGQTYYQ